MFELNRKLDLRKVQTKFAKRHERPDGKKIYVFIAIVVVIVAIASVISIFLTPQGQ